MLLVAFMKIGGQPGFDGLLDRADQDSADDAVQRAVPSCNFRGSIAEVNEKAREIETLRSRWDRARGEDLRDSEGQ